MSIEARLSGVKNEEELVQTKKLGENNGASGKKERGIRNKCSVACFDKLGYRGRCMTPIFIRRGGWLF